MKELVLKLKLQNSGHLMQRADSMEMIMMLAKIESKRIRGEQRMRWPDSIIDSTDTNLSKFWEIVEDREAGMLQSMGSQGVRHNLTTK